MVGREWLHGNAIWKMQLEVEEVSMAQPDILRIHLIILHNIFIQLIEVLPYFCLDQSQLSLVFNLVFEYAYTLYQLVEEECAECRKETV